MRRKLFLLVVVSMLISSIAFAEDFMSGDVELTDRWNFGVSYSAVIPTKDKNYDTGYNVQGLLSYDITKWLAVGVEAGFTDVRGYITSNEAEISDPNMRLELGHLYAFPLLGDIILKAPIEMDSFSLVPYVTNGFGVLFSDVKESAWVRSWDNTISTNTPFLYKLGLGTDFYIGDFLALNFEASYQWADISYTPSQNGIEGDSIKIPFDSCYIGGGLKLKF